MRKGYLARYDVSFEIDSNEEINEAIIKGQNPHLPDEQVLYVLETLTQIEQIENEEPPAEDSKF